MGSHQRTIMLLKIILFFLPLCAIAGTNDGSILLMNDSTFILSATIQAADGTFLGQQTLQPGQQSTFTTALSPTTYQHPGTPKVSLTPYVVIWQCSSEDYYSMCSAVPPGSLVRANGCEGTHVCKPKKKSAEQPPASTIQKTK